MLSAVVGLLTGFAEDAYADSVSYRKASYDVSTGVTYTPQEANATEVTASNSAVTWGTADSESWYYVSSNTVEISARITVAGTVNLILYDGATLTAAKGITVNSGNTLNIYAQTGGTGRLTAGNNGDYTAGIGGGGQNQAGGTVTIHGGTVTAAGGNNAQGIGRGTGTAASGDLTVSGDHIGVFGGSTADSADIITDYAANRPQYMQVMPAYTVSFDKNADNASGTMSVQVVKASSPTVTLSANSFDRTAYTFSGWNTLSDSTGTSYEDQASITLTDDITLYAQWTPVTYTITYNLNGGTNNSSNPASYDIETPTITLNAPTKAGYTFTGWTMDGAAVTTIPTGSTGNKTLTANFTPTVYTITYELNGGTNDPDNPASYDIETPTITLKAATKEGYAFDGWTMDGLPIAEIPEGSSGDKTITANWGDSAPVMSAGSYSLSAYKGQPASLTISATGLNLSWSLDGELPAGLAFSGEGSTAEISGTPEFGTSGTYSVIVAASNESGAASADVAITVASDFAQSGDTKAGDPETVTTDSGASSTITTTTFTNGAGNIILAAEIAITTDAEELVAVSGEAFTATVNVDVSIDIHDTDYNEYAYSMEILDLPEWLTAEGELTSTGELESSYHHEFTLSGTPLTSQDAEKVTFVAAVTIAGEEPALDAYGSKEVFVRVSAEKISGDVSPDVVPDLSPDVTPQPDTPDSDPDTPAPSEPVVIEDGKLSINDTTASGDSGGSSVSIADVIANLTDEEKQSITQIEINSDVENTDWVKELTNLEVVTIAPEVVVDELDLSGNTNITELNTQGAVVKSINLAGCTNIVSIDCAGCGTEKINADGCVSLTNAGMAGNSLLKFDAEGLPSLQSLDCSGQSAATETIGQEFSLGGTASAAFVMRSSAVSDRVKNLKAFDAAGNEIAAEYNAATDTLYFASAPAKVTYDYDTGFNGVMMDVTLTATSAADNTDPTNPDTSDSGSLGSNGGGCDSGFGMTAVLAGVLMLLKKRR